MSAPHLLVRVPNWLGDCVMSLPCLAALREARPEAKILVACRAPLAACYAADPSVDGVVECPASGGLASLWRLWASAGRLRGLDLEAGLLLTNSFSSAFWLWRSGARRRIGFDRDGRGAFLTERIAVTDRIAAAHQSEYYLELAARLGADPKPRQPALALTPEGRAGARGLLERLALASPYAVLAPMSAYGAVKDWPAARYAEVAAGFAARGLGVVVTGTGAQAQACAELVRAADRGAGGRIVSAAGAVDLAGFFALVGGAKLFVGGDSGGAHVAAALGVPTAVIFGITEPGRTRPLGGRIEILGEGGYVTPDLDDPAVREAAQAALARIEPSEVLAATDRLVGRAEGAA